MMKGTAAWRSNQTLILSTVTVGFFTDFFLYGIVVPVFPFLLRDRLAIPDEQIQNYSSGLLASYAAAAVFFSVPAGWVTDRMGSRRWPFLCGLILLLASTITFVLGQNIIVIMFARAFQGMSAAIVWTVGFAMVHDTVPSEHMGQAIGTVFSLTTLGDITAPVVGGFLYDKTGITGIFAVSAGLLVINFIMRLVMVDREPISGAIQPSGNHNTAANRTTAATEGTGLLSNLVCAQYIIKDDHPRWAESFPVLYCCREPRLAMAFVLTFAQSSLLGLFSATIPTEAETLFNFSSVQVGLLFIALFVPYLLLGPVTGKAVDVFGTRVVASTAYALLVPSLILLGLPSYRLFPLAQNIALFCGILALNGIFMVLGSSTSFVEASDVMERFEEANPGFFGLSGPFAQLYGLNALFMFSGLTVGPLVGGLLRSAFGFQVMLMVVAAISALMSILSVLFIGQRQRTGWDHIRSG